MSNDDWDDIQKVHIKGSFSVTKAAWPYMKKQGYGRIIITSSTAGIYGGFGVSNYGTAKLGLIGLSNILAIEGAKYGIHCCTVVPFALSRLSSDLMSEEMANAMNPHHVAPAIVWLCHESCSESGAVFMAGGGWYGRLKWYLSKGKALTNDGSPASPEQVRDSWNVITDMDDSIAHANNQEARMHVMSQIDSAKSTVPASISGGQSMNSDLARGYKFKPAVLEYSTNDVILYALGIGSSVKTSSNLRYLYEDHEAFAALPTFIAKAGFCAGDAIRSTQVPGLKFYQLKSLHGEEYIELYAPIPTSGKLNVNITIADLLDKGSGALLLLNVHVTDETAKKLAYLRRSVFLVGEGNFGGPRNSSKEHRHIPLPSRQPDAVVEQKSSIDQAALYRLAGCDPNPIHVDPVSANKGGFQEPILHGLCSLGHSVRHVLETYADNDTSKCRALKARFTKPVIPGQTFLTEMWKDGNRVHFQTKIKETGDIVVASAYVDLTSGTTQSINNIPSGSSETSGLKSALVFKELEKRLNDNPALAKRVNASFLWVITKGKKEAKRWSTFLANFTNPKFFES